MHSCYQKLVVSKTSWLTEQENICVYTNPCVYIYIHTQNNKYFYSWSILMFPTLIHYHMGHSKLSPTLISEETCLPTSATEVLKFSIAVHISSSIHNANSYSHRKQLYELAYKIYVQFLLPLSLQTPLVYSYLGQNHFLPHCTNFQYSQIILSHSAFHPRIA